LTGLRFHPWTSSPAGIPASRFHKQDTEKEKTMSDIYGHLYGMPFARWDHDTQSWRTCEATSLLDLPMFLEILPTSGSMRNGQLSQQPTLERPIEGNDYSSLPTPHAGLGERGRDGVILNPKGQQDLQHAIAHLLPTPSANDTTGAEPADQRNNRKAGGPMLRDLPHLLPTPRAQNGEERNMNIWPRPLNQPQNLENALALLGDSTSQPSNDGNTSLNDQHPTPQLWDQKDDHG
jgi:hypothetical protein